MQTIQTQIRSIRKESSGAVWRISYLDPSLQSYVEVSMGEGGDVRIGPRLSEVLSDIEFEAKNSYPINADWMEDDPDNLFSVKSFNDIAVAIEMEVSTYKAYKNNQRIKLKREMSIDESVPYSENEFGEEEDAIETLYVPEEKDTNTKQNNLRDSSYFLVGKVGRVIDGDTIDLVVERKGSKVKGSEFEKGKTVRIRFYATQTPETSKAGDYDEKTNAAYAKKYKITTKDAYKIADEAKSFVQKQLGGSGLIVVDLDTDKDGKLKTTYGRYVGMVYKTRETSAENVFRNQGSIANNINKTILITESKKVPGTPLGTINSEFVSKEFSRFDGMVWEAELGLNATKTKHVGSVGSLIDQKDPDGDSKRLNMKTVNIKYEEAPSNLIDYIEPNDDRAEKRASDPLSEYRVRIGDVDLVIPPLSINLNRASNLQKIKTLRSKSSIITKVGSSTEHITLQLYFHDLDSINGKRIKRHAKLKDQYYYMDGLRPLIAQFKKAPFLPIDNEYINETLGIHNVALVNLTVSTVPGFPHSLSATLVLAKFEHEAFMPQVEFLGNAINYPLLRWYYQEAMVDNGSPYRTYLSPIEGELTNDFTFSIADEDQLAERKMAIQKIRMMENPLTYKEKIDNKETEIGRLISDGKKIEVALKQWERYLNVKSKGLLPKADQMGYIEPNDTLSPKSPNPKSRQAWKEIYESESVASKSNARFYPMESQEFQTTMMPEQYTKEEYRSYFGDHKAEGFIMIGLDGAANRESLPNFYQDVGGNKDTTNSPLYYIPMSQPSYAQQILSRAKNAELSAKNYIDEYTETQKIIRATEGELDLVDYPIDGLILTNIDVMYENSFSTMHIQMNDAPTNQYLGSQDPYVQVKFEATQDAVRQLKDLLQTVDRYSKEYRLGITSGFMGLDNQLTNLFGVRTVLAENVGINTVPGFPGRFQVEMTLCGFNKTQKRTEELEGISPIYGNSSKADRHAKNYNAAVDNAIVEMKMRDLEVYPDLELPTYDELNAALPYISSGAKKIPNYLGNKYVDPDFYIATPNTLREMVKEMREKEHKMQLKDMMGVQMYTSNQMSGPLDGDASMWSLLNNVDESVPGIKAGFNWGGETSSSGGSSKDGGVFKSKEVQKYVEDKKKLKEPPTLKEWAKWGYGTTPSQYLAWKENPHPEEWQVYNLIYQMVDTRWVKAGLVFNDKKKSTKAIEKVTYSKRDDLYKVNWNYLADQDPSQIKNGKKVKIGKLSKQDFRSTNSKVTRERIANLIKAIFHVRSGWKQFYSNGSPIFRGGENSAGIGGVPLGAEAEGISEAKRLLWDWKYNITFAVDHLFKMYKQASNSKDLNKKSRPWDYMIQGYATGNIDGELKNSFVDAVYAKFDRQYNDVKAKYATPSSPMNLKAFQYKNGLSDHDIAVIKGDKGAIIDELLSIGYREVKSTTLFLFKEYYSKAETKKILEKKSATKLKKILDDYRLDKYGSGESYKEPANSYFDPNFTNISQAKGANADEDEYYRYKKYIEAGDYIDNADGNRLVNTDDPQELFREMFVDMLDYDHRFRLLRAFPTFQMFIIEEGRWMANYRLWDNLYGFNAIQSIDVHKNRKIAADTAIITMTNVYNNLRARSMDTSYSEWDYSFWDNLVLGNPNEKLLEARKELLNNMMLEPGARIHLRMGYGASVPNLPVVFNGTITEMDTEELVTVVAQGDGIELTNVISGDPDDKNRSWIGTIEEPRDLICNLMTSKGNWFKDVINWTSGNTFFKDNPLGVQHFGMPGKTPPANFVPFNTDYGEAAQNIYSSNGIPTFSQWTYENGESIPFSFEGGNPWRWIQPGDEDNILLSFYLNTIWDITQTIAYCSPDYIAAVHPFETRSTLFFGKPYWKMAHRYSSSYEYDSGSKQWLRTLNTEHRKPYMQFHYLDGYMDIISNRIKATSENMYTNVIVNYDGKQTETIYADYDIHFAKQKTTVIDAKIVSRAKGIDFWTSEKQALYYGASALRDYMKDMYQGELIVLGTPTLKPHDMCFMSDEMSDMNGNIQVKAVTHSFSLETGFVSSVQPDAVVVTDDMAILSQSSWLHSFGTGLLGSIVGTRYASRSLRKIVSSAIAQKLIKTGGKGSKKAIEKSLLKGLSSIPGNDKDVKAFKTAMAEYIRAGEGTSAKSQALDKATKAQSRLESKVAEWKQSGSFDKKKLGKKGISQAKIEVKRATAVSKQILNATKGGKKAMKTISLIGRGVAASNPIGLLVTAVATWAAETIAEKYRRKKASMQACLILPLKYQGREFTAGINGHKGLVVGDNPGRIDNFLSGAGFDGKNDGGLDEWVMDLWNWATDAEDKKYSVSEEDLMSGDYKLNQ